MIGITERLSPAFISNSVVILLPLSLALQARPALPGSRNSEVNNFPSPCVGMVFECLNSSGVSSIYLLKSSYPLPVLSHFFGRLAF